MKVKNDDYQPVSLRLPQSLKEYVRREAEYIGIPQHSMLLILIALGRREWEKDSVTTPEE